MKPAEVETDLPAVSIKMTPGLLAGLVLTMFLSALDQTILNTAIPKMSLLLGAAEMGAWIVSSYLLFATVSTPIAGKLCDVFGTKKVLLASTFIFVVTSILCACSASFKIADNIPLMYNLVLCRCLQGIGGGGMLAATFVAVGELTSARARGKFQGALAAAFLVAALIGPTVGGLCVDAGMWPVIFLLNVPLGFVCLAVLQWKYPARLRALVDAQLPLLGGALLIGSLMPMMVGFLQLIQHKALTLESALPFFLSACCAVGLIWSERVSANPFIPRDLLAKRLVSISLFTVFVSGISLFGGSLLLAVVLQEVHGLTAAQSGLALSPIVLVVAVASVISGLLLVSSGKYKMLTLSALILLCCGSLLIGTNVGASPQTIVMLSAISGAGLGLLLPIHTIVIQNIAGSSHLGVATSLTQFFRSLGGTLGTGLITVFLLFLLENMSLQVAVSCVFILYGSASALTIFVNLYLPEIALKKADENLAESQHPSF